MYYTFFLLDTDYRLTWKYVRKNILDKNILTQPISDHKYILFDEELEQEFTGHHPLIPTCAQAQMHR